MAATPTALDLKLLPAAKKLIDTYGKPMSLVTSAVGPYDATSGSATTTTKTAKVNGLFKGPAAAQFANNTVQDGDAFVIFASASLTQPPLPGDELVVDNVTWRILGTQSGFSGVEVCIYTVHVRS